MEVESINYDNLIQSIDALQIGSGNNEERVIVENVQTHYVAQGNVYVNEQDMNKNLDKENHIHEWTQRYHDVQQGALDNIRALKEQWQNVSDKLKQAWFCPACTFENTQNFKFCEMCETERKEQYISDTAMEYPIFQVESKSGGWYDQDQGTNKNLFLEGAVFKKTEVNKKTHKESVYDLFCDNRGLGVCCSTENENTRALRLKPYFVSNSEQLMPQELANLVESERLFLSKGAILHVQVYKKLTYVESKMNYAEEKPILISPKHKEWDELAESYLINRDGTVFKFSGNRKFENLWIKKAPVLPKHLLGNASGTNFNLLQNENTFPVYYKKNPKDQFHVDQLSYSVSELVHKAFQDLANGTKDASKFRYVHTKKDNYGNQETKKYEITVMGQFDDALMRDISDRLVEGTTRTWKVFASKEEIYEKKQAFLMQEEEAVCEICMVSAPPTSTYVHNDGRTHNFEYCRGCLHACNGKCPVCNLRNVKNILVQNEHGRGQQCFHCKQNVNGLIYEIQAVHTMDDNRRRYCAKCVEETEHIHILKK